ETVISPPDGTVSSHGVRQLWPWEVRASAPGGSDSTRKTSVAAPGLNMSRLGIDIEHAASARPHAATAITRLMVSPTIGTALGGLCPLPKTIRARPAARNQ